MKRLVFGLVPLVLAACAHLPGRGTPPAREALWNEAHVAFYAQEFTVADSLFARLAELYPETDQGREALFYIGTLHLDPRNERWSSERAETALREYLALDATGPTIHRRPEAQTLLELATQLNLPGEERVTALQPTPVTVRERVVVPAGQQRATVEENERLRRQLAERDDQIRRQREELERIRRTLTPRTP